jgi:hypothetical protein
MARLCGTKEKLKSRIASKVLRYPFFRPFGRGFLLDPGIHFSLSDGLCLEKLEVSELTAVVVTLPLVNNYDK